MPNVKVFNMAGQEVDTLALSDAIFGAEINAAVLHAAVRAYLLNQRQGTQSTLTRTEVSGGGKKPWRQKGTGRARQGSTRSPQWTHGGIALGPKPRSYRTGMNKKARRAALFSALSAKVAEGNLIVVDNITLDTYKTAEMVKMLKALGCEKEVTKNYKVTTKVDGQNVYERKTRTATVATPALVVLPEVNQFVVKSCANIEYATTTLWSTLNVYDIMKADKMIISVAAIKKLEEVYVK